jgi:hypothetical protein
MGLEKAKLTVKQQRAIEALLTEPTVQAAADAAGVSKTTIFRWLADSVFSGVYRDLRGQALEGTLTALQQASGEAVRTLKTVMTDETAKGSERVSAARCVLEMSQKAREVLEIEARLAALEGRLMAGRKAR